MTILRNSGAKRFRSGGKPETSGTPPTDSEDVDPTEVITLRVSTITADGFSNLFYEVLHIVQYDIAVCHSYYEIRHDHDVISPSHHNITNADRNAGGHHQIALRDEVGCHQEHTVCHHDQKLHAAHDDHGASILGAAFVAASAAAFDPIRGQLRNRAYNPA